MINVRIDFSKLEKTPKAKTVTGVSGIIVSQLDSDGDLHTNSKIDSSTKHYVDVKGKSIYYTSLYTLFENYDNVQITKL